MKYFQQLLNSAMASFKLRKEMRPGSVVRSCNSFSVVSAEIHTVSPEKVGRAFRVLICIKDVVMSSSKSVTASVWGKHWELPHLEDVAARFGNFC